jgi:hypothetical protein
LPQRDASPSDASTGSGWLRTARYRRQEAVRVLALVAPVAELGPWLGIGLLPFGGRVFVLSWLQLLRGQVLDRV